MAKFTVRIVLHDATWDDYIILANALAEINVTDVIVSDDGVKYKMPPAEYQCFGDLSAVDVQNICVQAALRTGKRHAVLVTEANARAWIGLERA